MYIKFFHVLFVFTWMGNLLTLTRFLAYHTGLDKETQGKMAPIYKRMYLFVDLPSMVMATICGLILLNGLDMDKPSLGALLMTFLAMPLIACDIITGFSINELSQRPEISRGTKYKVLHGITGLLLIAILASIYLTRS